MNLSKPFLKRPIMTTLVMVGILFFGINAYYSLPISDLPSIDYPVITVTAQNPGSDALTMANNVATPLEKEMMQIQSLNAVVSTSSYGNTKIVLQFDLARNIDAAATDVMGAIIRAQGNLPPEMPNPPSYQKTNPSDPPIIYVAVSSETMTLGELYDFANTAVGQRFSMVEGVSEVEVYGSQTAVRVKLNPDALAAMNLGLDEVTNALMNANESLPGGTVYDQSISYTILPFGQVTSGQDYEKVIVAERNGAPIFVKDIGRGVNSTEDEDYFLNYWTATEGSKPTVIVAVTKQAGFNTVAICQQIRDLLPQLRKEIPPSISLSVVYDRSVMIKDSINDVRFTLFLAFCLVVLVIFLFLGNISTSIIPILALPMAVIGTFAMMYALGYSVDILSMLGLTLVIGFLVDDAIVVLENIVRHMEMGKPAFQAAMEGSAQIGSTVLSMTLALSSVFIPLVFMPGIVGKMFHEFSMVIVIAVLFSGFISLTLTPMLASRFLRPGSKESRLEIFAKKVVGLMLSIYEPMLIWVLRHTYVVILLVFAALACAIFLFERVPKDFLPPGDTGAIQMLTNANEGASLQAMTEYQNEAIDILKKNPAVESLVSLANLPEFIMPNQGIIFANLKPIGTRKPIEKVAEEMRDALKGIVGLNVFVKPLPEIDLNIGTEVDRADYTYSLSTITNPEMLYGEGEKLVRALKQSPEFDNVSSDIQNQAPYLKVHILRDQASRYGISVNTIEQALQYGYSGGRISTYKTPINIYDIIVQMEDGYRKNPTDLAKIRLTSQNPNTQGQLIPLNTVARWEEGTGPLQVNHKNQFTAANIYFNLVQGAALSTALEKIRELSDEILSPGVIRSFQGSAEVFQKTMSQMGPLLLAGIVVIYLLLGSLYESFIHPITILSTLPGAIFGGLVTLFAFNATLSLYAYVGMIVLIGIVLKNGIMLVEFANESVEKGTSSYEAIIEASKIRFRPILMTTVAAAMGAVPIAFGIGSDAASRRPLGLVILGGLFFAQLITYFFTPIVYIYMQKLQDKLKKVSIK